MRIIRYQDISGRIGFAEERGNGAVFRLEGDVLTGFTPTEDSVDVVRLLAPILPVGILCIGLNYRAHAAETGAALPEFPVLFVKGVNTLQDPGAPIELPRHLRSNKVDYEAELVVVIGKRCKNVSAEDALDYVLGYSCGNDVSARDWQKDFGGGQWCRGKTFDTFAPIGPRLVTADEIPNPNNLAIRTRLNGELVQDANTSDMIFPVRDIIAFLSGSTTLLPGTVIFTGTPSGVGMGATPPHWLGEGDDVSVEIEKIGTLTNPVTKEAP